MTTKQLKKEIVEMLDAFRANERLIPSGQIEAKSFAKMAGSFTIDIDNELRNFFTFQIILDKVITYNKTAWNLQSGAWEIRGGNLLTCASVKEQLKELHKWLKAIHETLLPQKTQKTLAKIEKLKKQIEEYEKELEDAADQN